MNDAGADDPRDDRPMDRAVAEARDRFDGAWREGRRPRLEDHLTEASGAMRPALLRELLTVELSHRRLSGEHPEAEEYRGRFPDYPEVIEETLEIQESDEDRPTAVAATQAGPGSGARPEAPPEIPGYEILDVLGRGGMGVVYRARQLHLDRICALKAISAEGAGGAAAAPRSGIPTSSRSTTRASTRAASSSRWSTSRAAAWRIGSSASPGPPRARPG